MSTTYSECMSVALGIEHAKHMRRVILSSVALQYFCALSHTRHDFREKITEHKMRVLIFLYFSFSPEILIILRMGVRYCHKYRLRFM